MPDISDTLAPNSDQLDAVDLLGGPPRVFTITKVDVKSGADQPVSVHLAEFPRVWRPGKSMRRVLANCWGNESDKWVGQRVELYCDETVTFGKVAVGGTRISRLSGIDKPKSTPLIVSQGKGGSWRVDPLPPVDDIDQALNADLVAQVAAGIEAATTMAEVREWGNRAQSRNLLDLTPEGATSTLRELGQARMTALETKPADPSPEQDAGERGEGGGEQ